MTINSLAHFQFQCLKKLIVIKDFHPGFFALCEGSGVISVHVYKYTVLKVCLHAMDTISILLVTCKESTKLK